MLNQTSTITSDELRERIAQIVRVDRFGDSSYAVLVVIDGQVIVADPHPPNLEHAKNVQTILIDRLTEYLIRDPQRRRKVIPRKKK